MLLASSYPFLDVLWTMFIFFLWVIWFWLLFTVFVDVFRRHDIHGGKKTLWLIFVIILPFLGVFIYIITQNDGMTQRNLDRAQSPAGPVRRVRPRHRGRRCEPPRSPTPRSCSTRARSLRPSSTRSSRRRSPPEGAACC